MSLICSLSCYPDERSSRAICVPLQLQQGDIFASAEQQNSEAGSEQVVFLDPLLPLIDQYGMVPTQYDQLDTAEDGALKYVGLV